MKNKFLMVLTVVLLALALAACGSSSDTSSQDESQDTSQEQTQATEEAAEETADAVNPYAWLGLQDMPQCHYLDVLATNHYFKKSKVYTDGMSYVSKQVNAVDGINSYKKDEYTKVYSIDGKVTSLNESSKTYMQEDVGDLIDTAEEELAKAMENGENRYGRAFVGTGSEAIPVYSEKGDKAEYEYYEYNYPETEASGDMKTTERYYMKNGDVFAIYTKYDMGDTVVESTEVIKKMSEKIPKGTFKLPDLSKYEETKL